jgi:hypothetical protein
MEDIYTQKVEQLMKFSDRNSMKKIIVNLMRNRLKNFRMFCAISVGFFILL